MFCLPTAHCLTWICMSLCCPHTVNAKHMMSWLSLCDSRDDYFCTYSYTARVHIWCFVWLWLMHSVFASTYCFVCWSLFLLSPSYAYCFAYMPTDIPSCSSLLYILCCLACLLLVIPISFHAHQLYDWWANKDFFGDRGLKYRLF